MTTGRSEFGALLRRHRMQLGLTQEGLARHIAELAPDGAEDDDAGMLSERAISKIEAVPRNGRPPPAPRNATVRILARALGLVPGTRDYDNFFAAAERTQARTRHAADEPAVEAVAVAIADDVSREEQMPLVTAGRERELGRLRDALTDVLYGKPRVIFVAGDAGIGKSFLVREVCRRWVERADPELVVAWGECNSPHGVGELYQPVKQILARLTGDVATASAEHLVSPANRDRLTRAVGDAADAIVDQGPDLAGPFLDGRAVLERSRPFGAKGAWWFEALQRLVQSPAVRDKPQPDQLHEQVSRVLLRVAERGPVVLVLDDLHWADDGTCALLFHLSRRLRDVESAPLLVIGSYRLADLATTRQGARHPLESVVNVTRRYWGEAVIDLTATVGRDNGRAFIDALLDTEPNRLDDAFRTLLFERTEGHPLFATELLRWLHERDVVVRDKDGCWIVARDVTCAELPEKVEAVIAERIGRLPADLRETLAVASVQGQSFTAEVVGRVLGIDMRQLGQRLDGELGRRHRLVLPGGTISANGSTLHRYRFAHALFHDYLYGNLRPLERQSLHAATAAALEGIFGSDAGAVSLDIAQHFDLSGDGRNAARWYKRAGDACRKSFDNETARRCFARGAELARALDDQVIAGQCLAGIAMSLRSCGKTAEAIAAGLAALDAAHAANDAHLTADCLTVLGLLYYDVGRNKESRASYEQALPLYASVDNKTGACMVEYLLSFVLYASGEYAAGIQHAHSALALAKEIGNRAEEAESLLAVAYYHVDLGNYAAAIGHYRDALVCQRETGDRRGEAVSLINIGLCHVELGQDDLARAPLEQALQIGQQIRMPRIQGYALTDLGLMHEGLRQIAGARKSYAEALHLRRAVAQPALAIDDLAGLARCALADGDVSAARATVDEILAWFADHGADSVEYPVRVYLTCLRVLDAAGEQARARRVLQDALALLTERAGKIADPDLRRSFLERVPFNRALLAAESVRR